MKYFVVKLARPMYIVRAMASKVNLMKIGSAPHVKRVHSKTSFASYVYNREARSNGPFVAIGVTLFALFGPKEWCSRIPMKWSRSTFRMCPATNATKPAFTARNLKVFAVCAPILNANTVYILHAHRKPKD